MEFPHAQLETGRMKVKLKQRGHWEERGSTIQTTLTSFLVPKNSVSTNPRSLMLESTQESKKGTSKDWCKVLGKRNPIMRLSQKLPRESTGQGRSLTPFLTEYSKELSQKLWLLTKTDCVDLRNKKELRGFCLNKEAFDREDMKSFKCALEVH